MSTPDDKFRSTIPQLEPINQGSRATLVQMQQLVDTSLQKGENTIVLQIKTENPTVVARHIAALMNTLIPYILSQDQSWHVFSYPNSSQPYPHMASIIGYKQMPSIGIPLLMQVRTSSAT